VENNGEVPTPSPGRASSRPPDRTVIVDLIMDYSKRTAFTQGAVKTNFKRLPLAQRLRMVDARGETQDHRLTAPPLKISSQGSRLRFPHPTEENHEKNHRFAGSRFLSRRHLGLGLPGRQSQG
jgi:hypothetical protein